MSSPVITSLLTINAVKNSPLAPYRITATTDPALPLLDFDAEGLPAGLAVDHTTGEISGTPTESGNFAVRIKATNADGTTEVSLALSVAEPTPAPAPTPAAATVYPWYHWKYHLKNRWSWVGGISLVLVVVVLLGLHSCGSQGKKEAKAAPTKTVTPVTPVAPSVSASPLTEPLVAALSNLTVAVGAVTTQVHALQTNSVTPAQFTTGLSDLRKEVRMTMEVAMSNAVTREQVEKIVDEKLKSLPTSAPVAAPASMPATTITSGPVSTGTPTAMASAWAGIFSGSPTNTTNTVTAPKTPDHTMVTPSASTVGGTAIGSIVVEKNGSLNLSIGSTLKSSKKFDFSLHRGGELDDDVQIDDRVAYRPQPIAFRQDVGKLPGGNMVGGCFVPGAHGMRLVPGQDVWQPYARAREAIAASVARQFIDLSEAE